MVTDVNSVIDVYAFIYQLIDEGLNYHPDNDFEDYVNVETGEPSYTGTEASFRNRMNSKCFKVCESVGGDIYDISMEIFLKETGLDKVIPLPSQIIKD